MALPDHIILTILVFLAAALCQGNNGKDVKFLIQPKLMTTIPMMMPPTTVSNEKLNFLFLIHSSEDNAARRSVIRSTWASLRQVHEHKVQFIFCIRHQEDSSAILQKRRKKRLRSPKILPEWVKNSQETFSDVKNEASFHQDILLWEDANASVHLTSLSWLQQYLPRGTLNQTLIVITQDDMFVEIIHFSEFINAVYGDKIAPESLICDVISSGTVRPAATRAQLNSENVQNIPDYCHQAGIIMTPDLVDKLLQASQRKDLPYDPRNIPADLFFLGYLRETIGVRLKPLNPRYSYDDVPLHRWLQSQSGLPLPFLFAKVNEELMKSLWIKTEQIHHLQKSHGHQNIFH